MALLALSACTAVPIKNQEWCGDFSPAGADCFNTLRPEKRTLTQKEWDKLRFGQVCTEASNYGDIKAALEKLCSLNRCKFIKDLQAFDEVTKMGMLRNEEEKFLYFAHKFLNNVKAVDDKARRLRRRK